MPDKHKQVKCPLCGFIRRLEDWGRVDPDQYLIQTRKHPEYGGGTHGTGEGFPIIEEESIKIKDGLSDEELEFLKEIREKILS